MMSEDCGLCNLIKKLVSYASKHEQIKDDDVFDICAHLIHLHHGIKH